MKICWLKRPSKKCVHYRFAFRRNARKYRRVRSGRSCFLERGNSGGETQGAGRMSKGPENFLDVRCHLTAVASRIYT